MGLDWDIFFENICKGIPGPDFSFGRTRKTNYLANSPNRITNSKTENSQPASSTPKDLSKDTQQLIRTHVYIMYKQVEGGKQII